MENLYIPENKKYRVWNAFCFYVEYRTVDKSYVKVYHQKKIVSYADYKIGMFYVDPNNVKILKELSEFVS